MEKNQSELAFEKYRLEETILLAESQLKQARLDNEGNSEEIVFLKKEMRENSAHSITNLWNSQNFEDLIELSQYQNPITEKLLDYEKIANKITILKKVIDSPYFARIDFRFDDEDSFDKIYIGLSSLKEDDTKDILVYDWRAPIASMFYRFSSGPALYEAPVGKITGEIGLKRQYEIKKSKLEYFFDADVQIADEFLRKMLAQNTSSKMKTIVETIQKEQDVVIRDMEYDLMMVQGAAGSGKTSIALHRAAYLMYQGSSSSLSANNIIVISPSTIFEQYISDVLPELGEDNVISVVFDEILSDVLQCRCLQTKNQFLEIMMTNSCYERTMKDSLQFKTSPEFLKILDRFIDDLPYRWIDFEDLYYGEKCIAEKEELREILLKGRKTTSLGFRLKQAAEFALEAAKEYHREHENQAEYMKIKEEIRRLTELNIPCLYSKMFEDAMYFHHLAKDIELPCDIRNIMEFTQDNLISNRFYYDDAAAAVWLKLKIYGTDKYRGIKQVVVDEAQDYYPLHYEILKLLFPDAKYTILGDMNQTLEKKEDLSLYENIGKILNKKKATLVTMDKSYRSTNQILKFASRFIQETSAMESFNRDGDKPEIHPASDGFELCGKIISEVKLCLDAGYQSVGLLCKTEKNASFLYEILKGKLKIHLIKDETAENVEGVFIIPVYLSKGLEFDAVLICDTDSENYKSEEDKTLLYIASTRALHRLNLFCKGEISHLL